SYHVSRSVDKGFIEIGRVYRLSDCNLFSKVILKGALPSILAGVRYALGVMWLTLIVAETVAASSGIGYMAMNAREFMQLDIVVLAILLYAILGKLADSMAKLLESRFLNGTLSIRRSKHVYTIRRVEIEQKTNASRNFCVRNWSSYCSLETSRRYS